MLPPPQATNVKAITPKAAIAASLRLLVRSRPAMGTNPIQAQSGDGRNVLSRGDGVIKKAVVGAVVVTVTVTSTEEDPSRVTDVFERVHVALVGAPAHANWAVPLNPSMGAKVAV